MPTLITQLQANSDLSSFLTTLNGDLPTKAFVTAPANNTQLFVPTIKAFENAAVFLTGKSPAQVASIIAFHITTGSRYDRNAVIGTQLGQFQNDGASTTTSYLPTTAITDAVVSTKALAISLSKKYADGEMIFVEALSFEIPKTAQAKIVVAALAKATDKTQLVTKRKNTALFVLPKRDENVEKSFQNFSNMEVIAAKDVNLLELLTYKYVVIADPKASLSLLQVRASKKNAKVA